MSLNELKNFIKKEPELILYFYQPDHIRRMHIRCTPTEKEYPYVFYKPSGSNGISLKQKEISYFDELYMIMIIKNNLIPINRSKKLFSLYISEIQKKIKEIWPNCKFVVVEFSHLYEYEEEIFSKTNGIINIPELTNIDVMLNNKENIEKYNADNGFHPNEYYWDTVVPVMVDEIKEYI